MKNLQAFIIGLFAILIIGAGAAIVMLPEGYYAVGIVNSDITPANKVGQNGGSGMLTGNIMESFKAGIAANF